MSDTIWPVGTDSGKRLREELRAFIGAQLELPKYRDRLPRQHFAILGEGDVEKAGRVIIRVVSQADTKPPWVYPFGVRSVVEDWHQIALLVKADKSVGGAASVSAFFGALRFMFAARPETPEYIAIHAAGINDCRESLDGIASDDTEGEGVFFRQQLNLRCNTDTFLN